MPWIDARLAGTLVAVMLGLQAVCWLLGKGLGIRLEKSVVACAWLAPLVMLAPWLSGRELLVPCDILANVPGAPVIERPRTHDLLNDTVYQILPWDLEVRHALADRRLPVLSDTLEGGGSPRGNPPGGGLSPPPGRRPPPPPGGGARRPHPASSAGGARLQAAGGLSGNLDRRPPGRPQPGLVAPGGGGIHARRWPLLLGSVPGHGHDGLGALASGRGDPALPPPRTAGDRHHGRHHRRAPALRPSGDRGLRRPARRGLRSRPAAAVGPFFPPDWPRLRRRGGGRPFWLRLGGPASPAVPGGGAGVAAGRGHAGQKGRRRAAES